MDVSEVAEQVQASDARSKWIGVYVGVLATLLAVCTMGGDNAAKDATRANIEASNMWSFFQAKNIRRAAYAVAADDLELIRKALPTMPADALAAFDKKIAGYRADVARYTSDKTSKEGLDQLFERAKAIEKERDIALRRDPYFDVAQALLQIAIVLASVALIAGTNVLLFFSLLLGTAGAFLMANGFTLWVALPFFG
ncbi:MAG: DUF4337 domain-containing protein [Hyphomicrobiaceae bacterium]